MPPGTCRPLLTHPPASLGEETEISVSNSSLHASPLFIPRSTDHFPSVWTFSDSTQEASLKSGPFHVGLQKPCHLGPGPSGSVWSSHPEFVWPPVLSEGQVEMLPAAVAAAMAAVKSGLPECQPQLAGLSQRGPCQKALQGVFSQTIVPYWS